MTDTHATARPWVALKVDELGVTRPALLQLIRCALPAGLTRGPGPDCATPSRVWIRQFGKKPGEIEDLLLEWNDARARWWWGMVRVSGAEGVQFLRIPRDVHSHLHSIAAPAEVCREDADEHQVDWIAVCLEPDIHGADSASAASPAADSAHGAEADRQDVFTRIQTWHEDLRAKLEHAGFRLRRTDAEPLREFDDWRRPERRQSINRSHRLRPILSEAIAAQVANYRLLDDDNMQWAWATPLPSFEDCYLVEIVDRRDLRARRTEFIFDAGILAVRPLSGSSKHLREFDSRHRNHWAKQFADRLGVAQYLDFYTRSIYILEKTKEIFFELLIDPGRDLRLSGQDADLLSLLRNNREAIGLWPLEPEPGASLALEPASDTQVHYFSSLMLVGRNLYLVAFKVCLRDGLPYVDMLEDVPCRDGQNLAVHPMTLDPDAEFVLSMLGAQGEAGDATQATSQAPDHQHTTSSATGDSQRAEAPSWHGKPTARGTLDGAAFAQLMSDDLHRCLPRGEYFNPRTAARADVVTVADAISMRGWPAFHGSRLVIGVHFRGRVDLREITVRGSLTFAYCTFDEPLLLDDAEIDGSLVLRGSAFLGGASLRGALVRGQLDLSSAYYTEHTDPRRSVSFDATSATVDGDVDLRGMGRSFSPQEANPWTDAVKLDGTRINGSLRLGCGAGGHREPMLLPSITGHGCRIQGSMTLWGACSFAQDAEAKLHQPMSTMDFVGAQIGGDVELRPHDRNMPVRPFVWEDLTNDALDVARSLPRIARLDLTNGHIDGSLLACGFEVRTELLLEGARVQGDISLRSQFSLQQADPPSKGSLLHWPAMLGELNMRSAHITGGLYLRGLAIFGDLSLVEAHVHGFVYVGVVSVLADGGVPAAIASRAYQGEQRQALRTCISRSVELKVFRCDSAVRFGGVFIQEHLALEYSVTGPFYIEPALVPSTLAEPAADIGTAPSPTWEVVPSQIGSISVVGSEIRGPLTMTALQILGRPHKHGLRGLHVYTSTVRGDVVLWRSSFDRDLATYYVPSAYAPVIEDLRQSLPTWRYTAAVLGGISLQRCKLRGDCTLSLAKVDGSIDLSDSHVHGDLLLTSLRSHREAREGDVERLRTIRKLHSQNDWLQRTWTSQLSLAAMRCDRDVVLDGVHIAHGQRTYTDADAFEARHLSVRGDFAWANGEGCSLEVEDGVVRLEDANLNRFKLTDECLRDAHECVKLSRAKIRTFRFIWHGAKPKAGGTACFDLMGAEIDEWEFREQGASVPANGRTSTAADFQRLLGERRTPRQVWTAIEGYLRRCGHDEDADSLYLAMRSREQPERFDARRFARSAGTGVAMVLVVFVVLALTVQVSAWAPSGVPIGALPAVALIALLLLPAVRDQVHRLATGFGTTAGPIAWAWAALLALSMPIYLAPDNFELSNPARAAGKAGSASPDTTPAIGTELLDRREVWSLGHAFGIGLRYHVPIIGVRPVEDWDPHSNKDAQGFLLHYCYRIATEQFPAIRCTAQRQFVGLSPHAYVTIVQALNWILWPLLLTFIALNLWRRRPGAGA